MGNAPADSPTFTGYTLNNTYNSRLQPIQLQTGSPAGSILSLSYGYGLGVNNNGNVQSAANYMENTNTTFGYDGVNRLIQVTSLTGTGSPMNGLDQIPEWGNSYVYDAWGNRTQANAIPTPPDGMVQPDNFTATINSNNQFSTGYVYDAAGNMQYDGTYFYQYDEESRLAGEAMGAKQPSMYYLYNGEGERVAKLNATEEATLNGPAGETCAPIWNPIGGPVMPVNPILSSTQALTPTTTANGSSTWTNAVSGGPVQPGSLLDAKLYWGQGLAESDVCGNITKEYVYLNGARIALQDYTDRTGGVYYYFTDHLGSSSIVTDDEGDVVDESVFYPFGNEYDLQSSSGQAYKFTGKERDSETGLDNFGARYYSSKLARRSSPCWRNVCGGAGMAAGGVGSGGVSVPTGGGVRDSGEVALSETDRTLPEIPIANVCSEQPALNSFLHLS